MRNILVILIPAFLSVGLIRILMLPIRWFWKLGIHSLGGFLCLWVLNGASPLTGLLLPVSAATVLTAGFLGLPGVAVLAVLAIL